MIVMIMTGIMIALQGSHKYSRTKIQLEQPEAKNKKYSRGPKAKNTAGWQKPKIQPKVNDIYSIHSHYKGNHRRGSAAEGRGTSFVVARPKAAPPL